MNIRLKNNLAVISHLNQYNQLTEEEGNEINDCLNVLLDKIMDEAWHKKYNNMKRFEK